MLDSNRLLTFLMACTLYAQNTDPAEHFEKRVRPVFASKCMPCHSAKAKMGGLDLTSGEGWMRAAEAGSLISAEKPEDSRLLKVLGWEDKLKMPPSGKLPAEDIQAIATWVKSGAVWPGAVVAKAEAKGVESGRTFWAFQRPKKVDPPAVKNAAWVESPIDRFVLAKLEEKGLTPAPPAGKLALLRRVTLDLTGLPPTEAEMQAFLADSSPDAYRKVVDRLLASPRYGEKWGRHWLDVARYADSTGNDEDHRYPHAWRYRDYVIEAFNGDLPYDQFVREQIAGDLLPVPDESLRRRGIVATGLLALGQKAIAQQDKKKMLYDVYDEQVDVVSKSLLGLTVACARCHDHKFDPIMTKDYYALTSIFASTKSFEDANPNVSKLLFTPLVPREQYAAYKNQQDEIRNKQIAADDVLELAVERFHAEQSKKLADYLIAARRVSQGAKPAEVAKMTGLREDLLNRWVKFVGEGLAHGPDLEAWITLKPDASDDEVSALAHQYQKRSLKTLTGWTERLHKWRENYKRALTEGNMPPPARPKFDVASDRFFDEVFLGKGPFSQGKKSDAEAQLLSDAERAELKRMRDEIAVLKKNAKPEPDMACAVEEGESVQQHVFVRGDYNNLGEPVAKRFPLVLSSLENPAIKSTSGRLELAEWLTKPENPLTSRVMVNRVWGWHFGEGIVRTPDNFGKMGERPTNPELLDYLATQFVEIGWSVKSLHRIILLSSTYQMSSTVSDEQQKLDPENKLWSRFPRRRLDVEEMRDAMLAVDGSLDLTTGGTLQKGTGTDSENSSDRLSLSPEKIKRRTVYLPLRRANLPSLLNLFDFGDAATVTGKRQATNVAPQALFMMNSEFVSERSKTIADQVMQAAAKPSERIDRLYARVLNRTATAAEVDAGLTYIQAFQARGRSESHAWESFCHSLLASNEFIYID